MPYKLAASIGISKDTREKLEAALVESGWADTYNNWDDVMKAFIELLKDNE